MASSVLYLVRHAKAGERRVWEGNDLERPLSKAGWKQAELLSTRLQKKKPTALVSSPYVRCIQTLEPLATALDVTVCIDDRLTEAGPFEAALDLLGEVEDRTVLCSHGDIIPEVVQALVRRGLDLKSPPDWRKASVWVLKRKGGRIHSATVWPPPI